MKTITLIAALVILTTKIFIPESLSAQVLNLTQKDILTGSELGLVHPSDFITDVWGYYDADAAGGPREYAIVGMGNKGTQIVDVTDPSNIFPVLFPPIQSQNSYDVKTYGDYLYIANNKADNILIRNISNPTNPTGATFIEIDASGDPNKPAGAHNIFISDAGKLFVATIAADEISQLNHRVWIYDLVGNETQPVLIRSWSAPDLGLPNLGSPENPSYFFPHDMYVKGNTAYIAWSGEGVAVVDFDPVTYDTIKVRQHEYDGSRPSGNLFRVSHGTWVSDDGNYLYTTDEWTNFGNLAIAAILRIFDISNINSTPYPLVQFYDVGENAVTGQIGNNFSQILDIDDLGGVSNNSIHNVVLKEPFAYISYYTKGLRILDVSDPTNVLEVAYYDVPAASDINDPTTWADGSWGVYPFAPSGNIYVSGVDIDKGTHDDFRIFTEDFKKSGNITSNTTWSGYAYVTSQVTVNSGVKLTIEPGTMIKFANNSSLIVKGQLIAEGTPSEIITFRSINNNAPHSSWWWVYLDQNGGIQSPSSIKYAHFQDANYGIRAEKADNSVVENSTFENLRIGVFTRYQNNPGKMTIKNNQFDNLTAYGIYAKDSDANISSNTITNTADPNPNITFGYGIYLNSSSASLKDNSVTGSELNGVRAYGSGGSSRMYYNSRTSPNGGFNTITSNLSHGIYITDSAGLLLGLTTSSKGINTIFNNSGKEVYNNTPSIIKAICNDWSGTPTASDFFGVVLYDPYYGFGSPCGEITASLNNPLSRWLFSLLNSNPDYLYAQGSDISVLNSRATDEFASGNYGEALRQYKEIIRDFPNSDQVFFALTLSSEAYKGLGRKSEFRPYLAEILNQRSDTKAKRFAKRLMMLSLEDSGELIEALAIGDEILSNDPSDEEVNEVLSRQAMIFESLNDFGASRQKFEEIITRFPGTEYASFASVQMEILPPDAGFGKSTYGSKSEDISLPKEYSLSNNYPNPFNPVTRIEFTLPEVGLTRLIIYDLRGREVAKLINGEMSAGNHNVTWDASKMASGIYIYRITSGNFVATKKMVLLK